MAAISCDACALHKVRCTREQPCFNCKQKGLPCLYTRHKQKRGPKNLHAKTLRKIINQEPIQESVQEPETGIQKVISNEKIEELLRLYEKHYYSIWPVLCTDLIIENLRRSEENLSLNVAYLISAVLLNQSLFVDFIYRSKLEISPKVVAHELVSKSIEGLNDMSKRLLVSENRILCYFFLHVYYRNNGENELAQLYLREAITTAHLLGLHDPSTYNDMGKDEIHRYRKLYYLLFIAERYMALNFRLPSLLHASIPLPEIPEEKEPRQIKGFLEIIKLLEIPPPDIYDLFSKRKSIVDLIELIEIIEEMHKATTTKCNDNMSDLDIANVLLHKCWLQSVLLKEAFIFYIPIPQNLKSYTIEFAHNIIELISQIDPLFFEISASGDYSFLKAIITLFESVVRHSSEFENPDELDVLHLIIKSSSKPSSKFCYTSLKSNIVFNSTLKG